MVAVVAAHLRMQSIRLAVYLDDWLALNAIRQMLLRDRKRILELLSQLGFLINSEKSNLEPTQDITYIGGRFWLDKGIVLPTPDRIFHQPLKTNNRRQVGCVNNQKWIQTTVSKSSSFFGNQGNYCDCEKPRYFNVRSKKNIRKGSNRSCTFCRPSTRFLQYVLPGYEKDRGLQGSDKFETPQSVSQDTAFQDGHLKTVLNLVKEGDWAFSVDLKDAYFHILIHPSHR